MRLFLDEVNGVDDDSSQAFRMVSQRGRIAWAVVQVVGERGYAGASVGSVSAHAKVSRRSFYEAFGGLQDCFLSVLDEGAHYVCRLVLAALEREHHAIDGVRAALAGLLEFLESEPAFARVLLVEATAAGPWARQRREKHLAAIGCLVEERLALNEGCRSHPLLVEGVMAALLGVLHTQLVAGRPEPLIALLGPFMGLVTAPYLDRAGVTREIERGEEYSRIALSERASASAPLVEDRVLVPALLRDPRSRRARGCLLYLAKHPGASNRQIADGIGGIGQAQVSSLLARLSAIGLLAKRVGAPGHANAWTLSPYGSRVSHALLAMTDVGPASRKM